jgi:hypothetical protein
MKKRDNRPRAWLNFYGGCGLASKIGLKSREDIVAFLDAWQIDYEKRNPNIKVTEPEDEFFGFSHSNLGIPGTYVTGRRSFIPIANGKSIDSKKDLAMMSEEYDAYMTHEMTEVMMTQHIHIHIETLLRQ